MIKRSLPIPKGELKRKKLTYLCKRLFRGTLNKMQFLFIISIYSAIILLNTQNILCDDIKTKKYVLHDVNPMEGFNLRRDVYMRLAVMVAKYNELNENDLWTLVLPPWYRMYHWKYTAKKDEPIPWSLFFNMNTMNSFVSVIDFQNLFDKLEDRNHTIDKLYILKNYLNAFDGGHFTEKWEKDSDKCDFTNFWGYRNITIKEKECVRFQGRTNKLMELIQSNPNESIIMIANAEIVLHYDYASKDFWNCRKSMKFNDDLIEIAKNYIKLHFNCFTDKCDNYLSVHWRRGDFARSRKKDVPSLKGTVKQIHKFIKENELVIKNIFVATDGKYSEYLELERELENMGYQVYKFLPTKIVLDDYLDGGVAIIDQIICSMAAYFIGTHESTFTFRIQEEREILGFHSNTTFNRLCPDEGKCERPSIWKIVK